MADTGARWGLTAWGIQSSPDLSTATSGQSSATQHGARGGWTTGEEMATKEGRPVVRAGPGRSDGVEGLRTLHVGLDHPHRAVVHALADLAQRVGQRAEVIDDVLGLERVAVRGVTT